MLWWCWTEWKPHQNIISFLKKQNLEVYHLGRDWDKLLWNREWAIEKYLKDIRNTILSLISEWKKVHLWWNSFGWYLALKIWEEILNNVSSIVAIAPVIDPKNSLSKCTTWNTEEKIIINLPDWRKLPILNSNIENLTPSRLILPDWLIILWDKDEIIPVSDLELISWEKLEKHVLLWVKHWDSTSNSESIWLTRQFYSRVISN